jgi:hypothetical protein
MPRGDQASEACIYEIVVHGQPAVSTTRWLGDLLVVSLPGGDCLLRSGRIDQAALYGLVAKMRDLGLVLVSLRRVPESEERETGWQARLEG